VQQQTKEKISVGDVYLKRLWENKMHNSLYQHFDDYLSQYPQHTLYAILDGVKYPMLYSDLEEGVLEYDILFREEKLREALYTVAPFLVTLDFTHDATKEQSLALLECYGKGGGLFLASDQRFYSVLEAMRELFYIYTPQGDKGYMRFYDPKIFRHYITQQDKNTLYALFSDVAHYWCEDTKMIEQLLSYNYTSKGVNSKTIQLDNSKGA
jgi:hypothetical protein